MKKYNRIVLDPFCHRQFKKNSVDYIDYDMKQFQRKVNQYYQKAELFQGYAPFCKHIFIENFLNMGKSALKITQQNQHLLKTCYQARNESQLPVLKRFFPRQKFEPDIAKYLDIILYTKQQKQLMNQAQNKIDPNKDIDYDYCIIAVKTIDKPYQTVMQPITMMRNALGKQEGGAGVPLDKQKYLQNVQFWKNHAVIK